MNNIVDSFWEELSEGIPVRTADSDLCRVYKYQKKRLDDEGLKLRVDVKSRGQISFARRGTNWQDRHYKTTVFSKSVNFQRNFYKKGKTKPLKSYSDNQTIWTLVTDCKDYSVSGGDSYVCPNCGAVSTLDRLQNEGCAFCGTKFSMSELYPRVSGYFYAGDVGRTKEELHEELRKYIKLPLIICLIPSALLSLIGFDWTSPFKSIMSALFIMLLAAAAGSVVGYLIWCISTLGNVFIEFGKAMQKSLALGSREKFTQRMKPYSEEFSFEYFSNKVVSIFKTVIYSSKDERIPNYLGPETTKYDHVVEASFTGAMELKSFHIENQIVTVHAVAIMENFYYTNGSIKKRFEKIPMTVQKNLTGGIDYHFNIRAVKCPNCGGSFDALSDKFCPYCGKPLDMRSLDWVITKIG